MSHTLQNDTTARQYYFDLEGRPHIDYLRAGQRLYLVHTEVPPSLEGQGIGSDLVKQALADIERQGLRLVPQCPFVAAYVKRHPEWQRLVYQPGEDK